MPVKTTLCECSSLSANGHNVSKVFLKVEQLGHESHISIISSGLFLCLDLSLPAITCMSVDVLPRHFFFGRKVMFLIIMVPSWGITVES